jgi:hypothetical protein
MPTTKLGQIAERASRTGIAPSLVSEVKAAAKPEAKAPTKRRRKKAESKKVAAKPEEAEKAESKTD